MHRGVIMVIPENRILTELAEEFRFEPKRRIYLSFEDSSKAYEYIFSMRVPMTQYNQDGA